MSTPLMVDSWSLSLSERHLPHFATIQMVAELIIGDQKRKANEKTTITWWQAPPLGRTRPRQEWPRVYKPSSCTCCGEKSSTLQQRSFWGVPESLSCSWCLHTYSHFEVLGPSRLLILAPLSNPGTKPRIREKFLEDYISWQSLCKIQTGFQTCIAPGLSNGCVGLLVFLCDSSTCVPTSQHSTNQKKAATDNLGTKLWSSHQNMIDRLYDDDKSLFPEKLVQGNPWTSAHPKGDECKQKVWLKLKLILVHTAKERISEAVVGIVVFASVSARSLDRDPSWTPCGRNFYGTCQKAPTHLAKLHVPTKTRKTS